MSTARPSGAGVLRACLLCYKANFINTMVEMEGVDSVVELGSGDGNQAQLFDIPKYTGIWAVSDLCVRRCNEVFRHAPPQLGVQKRRFADWLQPQ